MNRRNPLARKAGDVSYSSTFRVSLDWLGMDIRLILKVLFVRQDLRTSKARGWGNGVCNTACLVPVQYYFGACLVRHDTLRALIKRELRLRDPVDPRTGISAQIVLTTIYFSA